MDGGVARGTTDNGRLLRTIQFENEVLVRDDATAGGHVVAVEADHHVPALIIDIQQFPPESTGRSAGAQHQRVPIELERDRPALRVDHGGKAVDSLQQPLPAHLQLILEFLRNDPAVVGEAALVQARGHGHRPDVEPEQVVPRPHRNLTLRVAEKPVDLLDCLLRQGDPVLERPAAVAERVLAAGESVAVGGGGPEQRLAALLRRVKVDAVQVEAGVVVRHGHPAGVDQALQFGRRQPHRRIGGRVGELPEVVRCK